VISVPDVRPPSEDRGRVAFVLTGGASRAAVQVGMLQALSDAGLRPDLVVGASAGAVNAVAFAADPTDAGISRMRQGWRQARRSGVFPLWPSNLLLGAIGRRDHFFANRGLAALIREFVDVERLEASVIPVHVVATDLSTGEPVVLSQGPVLRALLASTAIPGVFPPVEVGGRLLVDGGISSDAPALEAETLGASTIYVLPTFGSDSDVGPVRSLIRVGFDALGQRLGQLGTTTLAATTNAVVRVIPAPPTAAVSPYDFTQSDRLIRQAADRTRDWLVDRDAIQPGSVAVQLSS
jgi:NTE family protein